MQTNVKQKEKAAVKTNDPVLITMINSLAKATGLSGNDALDKLISKGAKALGIK